MRLAPFVALAACLLLVACATSTPRLREERAAVRDFSLEARFALRVATPGRAVRSSGGRLSWGHAGQDDRILLASPLGVGMAEIEFTPLLARLQTADGQRRESPDADALIEEVTGQRLPLRRFSGWLLGNGGPAARLEKDASGRPLLLDEDGWQVDYAYGDDLPGALPVGLVLRRDSEIELRLRVEDWKEMP